MGQRSIKRGIWSPQLLSRILPLALLTIIVLFQGATIVTGSPRLVVDVPTVGNVDFSSRIESLTSTPGMILTKTSVRCDPQSIIVNGTTSCIASVANSNPGGALVPPTGNVSFSETGIASPSSTFTGSPCNLGSSITGGPATCAVSFSSTSKGTASITGTYEGDTLHDSSKSTATLVTVNTRATTTTVSCTSPLIVNQESTCMATVTDSSPGIVLTPTGPVTFALSGVTGTFTICILAAGTTAGAAMCASTFTASTAGTASITGIYGGDPSHSGSTTSALLLSIRGFVISTASATLTLFEGTPSSIAITLYSVSGFSGTVGLSASCTSSDVKVGLTSTNVTLGLGSVEQSLTLTGFAPSYVAPGNYTITVIGTDGSLSVQSVIVTVVLSVPRLSVPSFVTATPGSLLTFKVNATESDKTRILLLTALPSSLPNGAYFTSVTGNGTLTGIFDWALSQKTRPGNYTMIFRVSDDRGGSSAAQVVVAVLSANRSSTLPLTGSLRYVAIAALGVAVIIVGDRLWRVRKPRPSTPDIREGSDSGSR